MGFVHVVNTEKFFRRFEMSVVNVNQIRESDRSIFKIKVETHKKWMSRSPNLLKNIFSKYYEISESTGRDIFSAARRFVSTEGVSYLGGSGGIPRPPEAFLKKHSETLFPVFLEPKNQFPRQGSSSLNSL